MDFKKLKYTKRVSQKGRLYGIYNSWKSLLVLAYLCLPPSDQMPAWTTRALSRSTGISRYGLQKMLKRLLVLGWVERATDAQGRDSWLATGTGSHEVDARLAKRMRMPSKGWRTGQDRINAIRDAMDLQAALKALGWNSIMIQHTIYWRAAWRIRKALESGLEKADRMAKEGQKIDLGAYVWICIWRPAHPDARIRALAEHYGTAPAEVVDHLVEKVRPFRDSATCAVAILSQAPGTPQEVDKLIFEKQKAKEWRWSKEALRKKGFLRLC